MQLPVSCHVQPQGNAAKNESGTRVRAGCKKIRVLKSSFGRWNRDLCKRTILLSPNLPRCKTQRNTPLRWNRGKVKARRRIHPSTSTLPPVWSQGRRHRWQEQLDRAVVHSWSCGQKKHRPFDLSPGTFDQRRRRRRLKARDSVPPWAPPQPQVARAAATRSAVALQ